jgi:major vault protein
MDERGNKRDLVLAPGEYAYMQDVTKGIIKTYTGPTVINPTAQERPISFSSETKRFESCTLEQAVQVGTIAPEGYYVILKNPSLRGDHPAPGGVYPSPDLEIGRKININGPCDFALWPGQIVKLVQGHHLRSNQYLLVRVYNEEEARKNWGHAVIKPAEKFGGARSAGGEPSPPNKGSQEAPLPSQTSVPDDLTVGKLLIIKGTDVSFYIPPTGVGVVPDETGRYVRDALTLERLEYCILVDQNGNKRYERGPQVVFPQPTETFITKGEHRKFRALELNEIQGLHLKVIAPYEENGRAYKEGDEIFITGKETAIYFPREEHSLVRYDGKDKHFAVAIPAGEARYVMNRKSGEISMVKGPAMLLPNPIDEVIVRRVLSDKECQTWYPGNDEALAYNRSLRQVALTSPTTRSGVVSEGDYERSRGRKPGVAMEASSVSRDTPAVMGDVLERGSAFTQPRTLVFQTKYEGVPTISVYVGYAVMVVDKSGRRRVEVGPANILLAYDETLEILELSTGKPKSSDKTIRTAYLRVLNNIVSDSCVVETSDHVRITLKYSMRVNFADDPARWFEVENYVKLLCDHVRSRLKGAVKHTTVEAFYGDAVETIRDTILGKVEGEAGRSGMRFPANGVHVTDVEVLDVDIEDPKIAALLHQAQHEAVEGNITLLRAQRNLGSLEKSEALAREEAKARALTTKTRCELDVEEAASKLSVVLATVSAKVREYEEQEKAATARAKTAGIDHRAQLDREKLTAEQRLAILRDEQTIATDLLRAEVDAMVRRFEAAQSGFSEALLALSNHDTLVKVADAMSVQSFIGGKTFVEVVDKVFAGTPLEALMTRVKARGLEP